MFKESDKIYDFDTELLRKGAYIEQNASHPESAPIYLTTAFNVDNLYELQDRYDERGFCYNRNRNPNRNALAELLTYLENGEQSAIFSSGMAAISTSIFALVKAGDHIVADQTLYGESIDVFKEVLPDFGVHTTFVDFSDAEAVKAAVQENTKILYTETVSNPMISVVDIEGISDIAHSHDALLIVDNTFMTAYGYRPLNHGADIVVNSLTKFANGHSDAVCGAATGKKEWLDKILHLQVLLGSTADAFTSWLVQRGMRTLSLRLAKQMDNAAKLASFLETSPHISKVNHPSLLSHKQHELAEKMFSAGYGGMLSIVLPDDAEKLNAFMSKLKLAHYAMTLGGYRTTLSHPVMSSHYDTPEETRKKMGITYGLLRISVGIENAEDLIEDFREALTVYDT